jgi:ribosomal protein S18 acetylase RimI-like enzyme
VSSEQVTISQATPGMGAQLHALARETFHMACPPSVSAQDVEDFLQTQLSAQRFEDYLTRAGSFIYVARPGEHGPMVGYVLVHVGDIGDQEVAQVVQARPAAELSKCYVLASCHGSGTARQLLDVARARAKAMGASTMWLGVNQENVRAQRFYAKCGFARVGVKHFLVGEVLNDDFIMECALT